MSRRGVTRGFLVILAAASTLGAQEPPGASSAAALLRPDETHLRDLRQLTFGGENAEAYWSPDGQRLIFQARTAEGCDQAYVIDVATGKKRLVSTGRGRVTCAYFLNGGRRILYSSTHLHSPECPPRPDFSKGYVWPMYAGYDVVAADADGGGGVVRLTETAGYDAEATVSPDGKAIVFTSVRDGDLEIYTMKPDGSDVKRLTREPGYDGGPFFSPDGKRIVYRRDAPADEAGLARYRELLGQGLYAPGTLEIWVMDQDGGRKRQVTRLGAASFAPYFHPDGRRIVFSSNHPDPKSRNFDLYLVRDDGTGLERVTSDPSFDGFPMFSPDGKRLVFASNRGAKARGETNIFVADWAE